MFTGELNIVVSLSLHSPAHFGAVTSLIVPVGSAVIKSKQNRESNTVNVSVCANDALIAHLPSLTCCTVVIQQEENGLS